MRGGTTRRYTVGEVADLAGVTIRTLHHYERIGLLAPSSRSDAGYRLYGAADIDRLSRVLYYRELGFSLDDIATILADDDTPVFGHLERQHQLLEARSRRMQAMVAAVEREMEATMGGYNLTAEEKLEVFGDFDPEQYEDEAKQRWGDTDAWKQSRKRPRGYSKQDWQDVQSEMDALNARFVALMQAGTPADGPAAMDLAEAHRRHISDRFYECSPEIHRGLGEMYVDDPCFKKNINATATGLAAYLRGAFIANAERYDATG